MTFKRWLLSTILAFLGWWLAGFLFYFTMDFGVPEIKALTISEVFMLLVGMIIGAWIWTPHAPQNADQRGQAAMRRNLAE